MKVADYGSLFMDINKFRWTLQILEISYCTAMQLEKTKRWIIDKLDANKSELK